MKNTKEKKPNRFSRTFQKDDARHYIVYAELCKLKIENPYQIAEIIIQALRESKLL